MPKANLLLAALAGIAASSAIVRPAAAAFTGPTSPYYLDDYANQMIYVVQGASLIRSFPTTYDTTDPFAEANLAVSSVVATNGNGSTFGGPYPAGQYSLLGMPTGVAHTAQATPGLSNEYQIDGTSDGVHNYTVDYGNDQGGGQVIQTDLNWQSPTVLFSIPDNNLATGIAYDSANDSLWFSDRFGSQISDYSRSGTLLSTFNTGQGPTYALGYDAADGTLWFSSNETNLLEQWTTSGTELQSGRPLGLTSGAFLAGDFSPIQEVPEPGSLTLLAFGLAGLGVLGQRLGRTSN